MTKDALTSKIARIIATLFRAMKYSRDDWSCVWYNGKDEESVGWMHSQNIDSVSFGHHPKLSRWIGTWTYYDSGDTLFISQNQNSDQLNIEGTAIWRDRYVENLGMFKGRVWPSSNRLKIADGGCKVKMTLVNQYLIVSDNHECGGINVNFDGIYLKSAVCKKHSSRNAD